MILTTPDEITLAEREQINEIFNRWLNGPEPALIIGSCKVSITAVPAESVEVRSASELLGL